MGIFSKNNKSIVKDNAKFIELECSTCNKQIYVVNGGIMLIYMTDSKERAKAHGFNGYCPSCSKAFCSQHAIWEGIPPIFSPKCPLCSNLLSGYTNK